ANAGRLPMFGFPTRVRLLYTRWPHLGFPWPPERGLVDRPLDIAISQFAPGSETIKDKAVHRACGVVEMYPQGRDVCYRPGFAPDLPLPAPRIGTCTHCQAVALLASGPAPAGTAKLPPVACPVCHRVVQRDTMQQVDAREPKGFFTDQRKEDFEGTFEWTPRATRPTLN